MPRNLRNHINGYSASAREIIEYFSFDDQIERMDLKADILFEVVKKFGEIDLSEMDTMQMGYVFEDFTKLTSPNTSTSLNPCAH